VYWRPYYVARGATEPTFTGDPQERAIGWRVDAQPFWPGRQPLEGGVFPTIEQAVDYTLGEMEKYALKNSA
jgi:hypothetical protein